MTKILRILYKKGNNGYDALPIVEHGGEKYAMMEVIDKSKITSIKFADEPPTTPDGTFSVRIYTSDGHLHLAKATKETIEYWIGACFDEKADSMMVSM